MPYHANSVFNPGAARLGDETVLLTRVEDLRGISQLHVARSRDGISDRAVRRRTPPAIRHGPSSRGDLGLRGPSATWLPEREEWAIAYTAYSRRGLVSLAMTPDLTVRRLGPAMPPEDKDAALFPADLMDDGR